MSEVELERPQPGVAIVRINRPEVRNALNMAVRRQIAEHFRVLSDDAETRAIVVTGDEKAFAAGADIREMAELGPIEVMQRGTHLLWRVVSACPKPVIAAVNGFALGGGCELAMLCDIIIAGEGARFGQPEVRVGIIPGSGATQRLTRAVGKFKAMKIMLTGEMFSAAEADRMGLVSEVVPDADVMKRALEVAATIAAMPPLAVAQLKEVLLLGADAPLAVGLGLELRANNLLFASEDQKEGMRAFLEKRKPEFKGR
jgi:enoyl-CoA hydratase/carnithine racemase